MTPFVFSGINTYICGKWPSGAGTVAAAGGRARYGAGNPAEKYK